ncbi:endonuclease [Winogradskyella arenosi]|uniref:Putative secreted protein (Por secretion system target) n=1 Tax=Winogradskyella arenosi TaxID=533325 RepID=A0A368ZDW8_9FLAO|nr:endonuclease [Winogradskyella arenosi]RCW91439.1 putative secreted protein (Por secretion system target) [Winogradskyella arenosi]
MKQIYLLLFVFITTTVCAQLVPPTELESYYNTVDFTATGISLKNDLIEVTENKHTNYLSYSDVWEASMATDLDPDNANNVLLLYGYNDTDGDVTTDRTRGKTLNGGNVGDWNREHVYPKSLGNPNLGTSGPGSDAQMLRPSDVQRNGARGNLLFAEKSANQFLNGESGSTNGGWYPGDEWKGDCARIIMYMYIRYGDRCLPTNAGIGSSNTTPDDMIDLFLEWNAEDPVVEGGIEDLRNSYHSNTSNTYAQGNRNPFIDNPYIATAIWGGPEAQNRWDNLSIEDNEQNVVTIYPNPVRGNEVTILSNQDIIAEVYDILGKKVKVQSITNNQKKLNISGLSKGVYLLKLNSETGSQTKRLIKQ